MASSLCDTTGDTNIKCYVDRTCINWAMYYIMFMNCGGRELDASGSFFMSVKSVYVECYPYFRKLI